MTGNGINPAPGRTEEKLLHDTQQGNQEALDAFRTGPEGKALSEDAFLALPPPLLNRRCDRLIEPARLLARGAELPQGAAQLVPGHRLVARGEGERRPHDALADSALAGEDDQPTGQYLVETHGRAEPSTGVAPERLL